jgi:hypothetical protein
VSQVVVELPAWACELAHWEVRVGERAAPPGTPLETPPGPTRICLDAVLSYPALQAAVRLALQVDVPPAARLTVTPPFATLRALAGELLARRGSVE